MFWKSFRKLSQFGDKICIHFPRRAGRSDVRRRAGPSAPEAQSLSIPPVWDSLGSRSRSRLGLAGEQVTEPSGLAGEQVTEPSGPAVEQVTESSQTGVYASELFPRIRAAVTVSRGPWYTA